MTRRKNPFPYVRRNRSKGRIYWKFELRDFRCNLPGPYASPQFVAAYEAALVGAKAPRSKAQEGSISWLVEQYLGGIKYKNLALSRKKTLRAQFDWLRRQAGDLPFARLEVRHVEALMGRKAGPAAANAVKKNLSLLFNYAIAKLNHKGANPARAAERFKMNADGFHTWTDAEVSRFLERHGAGTKARLALLLALNTGMARQDLARVGWQHVKDGRISYRRGKTSVVADLPILPELAAELAHMPADQMLFITHSEHAKGYTTESLGNWFKDRCDEAGVPGRLHGLRKAGATRLADAGASEWEVASYLAHADTREASTYTKKANRAKLADSGFAKLANVSNLPSKLDRKAGKADE
jgi:integrase